MNLYDRLSQTHRQRISDGAIAPILDGDNTPRQLVLVWSQLGDFDNLEYAWWLKREAEALHSAGWATP